MPLSQTGLSSACLTTPATEDTVQILSLEPCVLRAEPIWSQSSRDSSLDHERDSCLSDASDMSVKRCLEKGHGESETCKSKPGGRSPRKLLSFLQNDPVSRKIRTALWTVVCLTILILAVYSLYSTVLSGNIFTSSSVKNGTTISPTNATLYNTTASNTAAAYGNNVNPPLASTVVNSSSVNNVTDLGNSSSTSCHLPAFVCGVISFFRNLGR